MPSARISFTAKATEDEARIKRAIAAYFPQSISSRDDFLHFRNTLFSRKILDTVRSRLLRNASEGSTFVLLHKQALLAGKISVCDSDAESPLGAVRLEITDSDIKSFIDWLSPTTLNGVPVTE